MLISERHMRGDRIKEGLSSSFCIGSAKSRKLKYKKTKSKEL